MQKKIKVLYIAGSSRGGTTLLDRLLGQVECFFSAGELMYVWERGFKGNQLCGCGKPFNECETWTGIVRRAFGDSLRDGDRLRSAIELTPSFVSLKRAPLLMTDRLNAFIDEFVNPLYSAMGESTGCKVIVDSSKTPFYLYVLSKSELMDLQVVHLVRDPRAVAYSWGRKKLWQEVSGREEFFPRISALRTSLRWMVEHPLITRIGKSIRCGRYMLLRYEDLARSPKAAVKSVLDFVGVEDGLSFFTGEHRADLKHNHSVSGNPVRFKTGAIDIRYDDEWMRNICLTDRLTASLITYPLRKRLYRQEG
jgi:hypothetical protein